MTMVERTAVAGKLGWGRVERLEAIQREIRTTQELRNKIEQDCDGKPTAEAYFTDWVLSEYKQALEARVELIVRHAVPSPPELEPKLEAVPAVFQKSGPEFSEPSDENRMTILRPEEVTQARDVLGRLTDIMRRAAVEARTHVTLDKAETVRHVRAAVAHAQAALAYMSGETVDIAGNPIEQEPTDV